MVRDAMTSKEGIIRVLNTLNEEGVVSISPRVMQPPIILFLVGVREGIRSDHRYEFPPDATWGEVSFVACLFVCLFLLLFVFFFFSNR